ncbi:MAG TPA: glycosyltransferase family 4 protein [Verrucomicrobiae bacterium]|nr:glycosyltransferase family 4 protein [Verrucomicrobiae bacterium]
MKIAVLTTDNREPYRQYDNPKPWFGTAPEALLQGFTHLPEAEVHVIGCTQRPMISSPEKLAPNIFFHSLHVPKIGWGRTLFQGCVRATKRKLREIKPDIVHGQGTERECALGAVFSGFPNVLTIHGNMAEIARMFRSPITSYQWIAARLENVALPRTAGVFCNSAYTESLVTPRTKKTWRVANPLRQEFLKQSSADVPRHSRCLLLNVGAITERKRQVELLEVAEKLKRQGLDFEIRFIGRAFFSAPYAIAFRDRLKPLEATGHARHIPEIGTAELIREMDAAHGLIHFPSEEAFGLVVAEALARDLKFFGVRLGGIPDIAEGIPGAELFDGDDWRELTDSLTAWIRQGHSRTTGAAKRMRELYHPLIIARRHLEIYREVLAKS